MKNISGEKKMDLEILMLSKVSQTQTIPCVLSHVQSLAFNM